MKTDFKAKNLIGRGSGESIQMAFQGQGWVLVQPSEGRIAAVAGGGGGGGLGGLLNSCHPVAVASRALDPKHFIS